MGVFAAKQQIQAFGVGAEAFGAFSKQPDTGPYKIRVLSVEDAKASETGELAYKSEWIVIDAPWNPAMVGRRMNSFDKPPQPGKVKPFEGKTADDTVKIREQAYKAMLISVLTSGMKAEDTAAISGKRATVNGWKGTDIPTGAPVYEKPIKGADGKPTGETAPREAYVFYEAFEGEGTNSNITWMDPFEYAQAVAKTASVKLRNEPKAARAPTTSTAGGKTKAGMDVDPLADLDASPGEVGAGKQPAAGSTGGGSVKDALDDL